MYNVPGDGMHNGHSPALLMIGPQRQQMPVTSLHGQNTVIYTITLLTSTVWQFG